MLGVDFGLSRIGVAVAESEFGVCSARPAMQASGKLKTDAEAIAAVVRREEADAVVLGLPVEESGEEGRMARIARQLAAHLSALGIQVELVDERFTSVEAERGLREGDFKASERRKRRDGEAAALILERFMRGDG